MVGWEITDIDKLLESIFANDSIIKQRMGITSGKARVANTRIPTDPSWFGLYIYFYCIPGPDTRGQKSRIMSNPDYDIEVRTQGAPTADSVAILDRIDELMEMSRTLTANGKWIVSAVPVKPINIIQDGETQEVYYIRRGRTYSLQVVASQNQ